jgi:V/A-type H+-transporting ATPase subunit I
MFFPNEMKRITVVSHKTYLKETVKALYEAGVLHLKEYVPGEGDHYPIGTPMENAEKISELLLTLNSIKTQVDLKTVTKTKAEFDLERHENFLRSFQAGVNRISEGIKQAEDALKAGEKRREIIDFHVKAGVKKFETLRGYGSLDVLNGYVPDTDALKAKMAGVEHELMAGAEKMAGGFPVIIFVKKNDMEMARHALASAEFTRIDLDMDWKTATPAEESAIFTMERNALEKKAADLRKELTDLTQEKGGELLGTEDALTTEIRKSEAPLKFAVSKHSLMIQGWVPKGKEANLEQKLASITSNMYFSAEEVGEHEPAPIQLKNKGPVKPFEFFLRLYSLPSYKEMDPTFLIFLTYPIIFGIMMGDIGYGLVLFLGFAFIKYKMKKMRSVASVLMISSLASILFGFVFGEFFGFEEIGGITLHPMIARAEGLGAMLPISLMIGLVHLNLGITTGLINELRERKFRHAMGKASWFILEAGGILYLMSTFLKMETGVDPNLSLGVFLVGVVLLTIGESYRGLIEIPALASNVLSYARIAALGLAGVQLALVINGMAEGMFHAGGMFMVMGVALLFAGHAVNMLLALMGSFLQSLRLHYVEMFSKFYHGDGEQYKPFGS